MHNFDAIILDLSLPDSPREETVKAIPAIKATQPDASIVVVTGAEGMRDAVLAAGADVFLSKQTPTIHRALVAAVHTALVKRIGGGTQALRESVELLGRIAKL